METFNSLFTYFCEIVDIHEYGWKELYYILRRETYYIKRDILREKVYYVYDWHSSVHFITPKLKFFNKHSHWRHLEKG